ncbi:MAG: hypothetical protein BAJATHORv1_30461 [Candidatus Thorarchaeota archaeon]|nr:MAG: hypothetical protein BAJATHORv1_30461 [Candidatus Thorarchaeota archaeon]
MRIGVIRSRLESVRTPLSEDDMMAQRKIKIFLPLSRYR